MFRLDRGTGNERFSTFPQDSLEVCGQNGLRVISELDRVGRYYSPAAGYLLEGLVDVGKQETVQLVKFELRKVGIRDFLCGLSGYDKIANAIRKAGLELLPPLTAGEMALHDSSLIGNGEYADILSKPLRGRSGRQSVFALGRYGGRLKLYGYRTDFAWGPDDLAVARLRYVS